MSEKREESAALQGASYEERLRLVTAFAANMVGGEERLSALVREGALDLPALAERIRPTGNPRISVRTPRLIRQAVICAIAALPRENRVSVRDIGAAERAAARLRRETGRPPAAEELAGALGVSAGRARALLRVIRGGQTET